MGETGIIIGDGMIGTAIKAVQDQFAQPWLVIAAGVSDSKNVIPDDYRREMRLIERCISQSQEKNLPILYISSYSVNDQSMINSPYVQNKLKIEQLILKASSANRILRITNAIGHGGNPSNIMNYLVHAAVSASPVKIWKNTKRNFIDADHIAQFVKSLHSTSGPIIELVHPHSYSLPSIIQTIESVFNVSADYTIVDSMENHYVGNELSNFFFQSIDAEHDLYLTRLLNKYYL